MENKEIKKISEFHRLRGLPKPEHPLISVIDYSLVKNLAQYNNVSWVLNFYLIGLKRDLNSYLKYGLQKYDFEEGVMSFMSPGQVLNIIFDENSTSHPTGTVLLVHPDFLWKTALSQTISKYGFFEYVANEALFLSEKEEKIITGITQSIEQEYQTNIDDYSADIIVSQLEVLLNYAERFYNREFITRKKSNHYILEQLEMLLIESFDDDKVIEMGLPTVQYVADELHLSANYLTTMLKVLTGKTTQDHIHDKLIDRAKEKLSISNKTINEIAFELGFSHSQSFSKLFKTRTNLTLGNFRRSLN